MIATDVVEQGKPWPRPRSERGVKGDRLMEIPRTMTATVLVAPHRFELLERPVPVPGDEDVLIRVRACGV